MEKFRDMCSKVKFQNIKDEKGMDPLWYMTWSSLYKAKHVTRLKLVEGKFNK